MQETIQADKKSRDPLRGWYCEAARPARPLMEPHNATREGFLFALNAELQERNKVEFETQTPPQADIDSKDGETDTDTERSVTGIAALDDFFYEGAMDEELAMLYACVEVAFSSNDLGQRIRMILAYRLDQYSSLRKCEQSRQHDPDTVISIAW